MLHACFTPIALCFVYTSWHFYVFFGTNLLTRCHSVSSCFLLFLYFRKVIQEIFSELDETKPELPIFLTRRRSPKHIWRRARGWPHHRVARVTPWPRHQVVWAPWTPSDIALPPINSLQRENSKRVDIHPGKVPQRRRHRRPISGGQKSLFLHPAGTGNCPRSHLHRLHRHLHCRC
jgi:hypothetical protein